MARTRSRSPRGAAPAREPRAVSRKKPAGAAAEAEVVEEAPGMGMEGAVAIVTALMLIAGCVFLDMELSKHYDAGFFF
ncbi:MAG: hypothetical protein ACI8TQ_000835 [Planctomycetota bacterium]|jgi:hypothetical protein